MSWERRSGRLYYYQTSRNSDGRRLKLYCGRGARGLQAYQLDLASRALRQRKRRYQEQINTLDHQTQSLYQSTKILIQATYYMQGWYFHHRELRRRKIIPEEEGSPVLTTAPGTLEPSLDQIRLLVEQAKVGNKACAPQIKTMLDACPAIWKETYSLAKRVEHAWIATIAGKDLLQTAILTKQVQAMRIISWCLF